MHKSNSLLKDVNRLGLLRRRTSNTIANDTKPDSLDRDESTQKIAGMILDDPLEADRKANAVNMVDKVSAKPTQYTIFSV